MNRTEQGMELSSASVTSGLGWGSCNLHVGSTSGFVYEKLKHTELGCGMIIEK
jgi:hypothetical protein